MQMFPQTRQREWHSYSIMFPQEHNFTLSRLVTRMEHAAKEFDVEISRDGKGYVQYTIDSDTDIGPALRAILTSGESQCVIAPKPVTIRRYVSFASMRKESLTYSAVGQSIHSALTMLRQDETLSVQARFRSLGRLKRFNEGKNKVVVSVTLRFTGSTNRLRQLLPETTSRRKWKVTSARKARRTPHLMDVRSLDFILPPDIMKMKEAEGTSVGRHYLPPSGEEIAFEGIRDAEGSMFQIGAETLTSNTFVAGGTGTGKTTMLANIAAALIASGRQVLVIDPHGDLGRKILDLVQTTDEQQLVYIDPTRCPVGLNPFNVLSQDSNAARGSSLLSDSIGYVIRRTYGESAWGNRMGYLLKVVLQSLAEVDRANFVDVMQVLGSKYSREQLMHTVKDRVLKNFLKSEMESYTNEWVMPIKDKLGTLIMDDDVRVLLCKRDNNVDISSIMQRGLSLILDSDMTKLGRETTSLLGSIILSMFWLKASVLRNGLTIIVDEFQNYPPALLKDIAEGGRKYGVNVVVASQSPSALNDTYLNSFATNFQNKIIFRLGREDAFKASRLVDDIDYRELVSLPNLECIFSNNKGNAALFLSPVYGAAAAVDRAVQYTRSSCSSWDDTTPSIFGTSDMEVYYLIQGVRTAETYGKKSVEELQETGFLKLVGKTKDEFVSALRVARTEGLVDKRSLKLTRRGREEMLVLQGGVHAGYEEHRMMALRAKDLFESFGYVAFIIAQADGVPAPDLVAMPGPGTKGLKLSIEIELSTANVSSSIRKKLEMSRKKDSVPVLVFADEGEALRVCSLTQGAALVLLFTEEDVKVVSVEDGKSSITAFTGKELDLPNLEKFAMRIDAPILPADEGMRKPGRNQPGQGFADKR